MDTCWIWIDCTMQMHYLNYFQLVFLFTQTDEMYVRKFLNRHLPEIVEGKVIFGTDLILNALTIIILITIVVTPLPAYIMIIYYRWKVSVKSVHIE